MRETKKGASDNLGQLRCETLPFKKQGESSSVIMCPLQLPRRLFTVWTTEVHLAGRKLTFFCATNLILTVEATSEFRVLTL
jgi:hypothetical protein